MNNKYLAKYIGLPFQDMVKGTKILKTLKFLKESQYWDEEKINDYQLSKLKNLVDYAKSNVPYYEDQFGKLKLCSSDIRSLDDIYKIPILTKRTLQEHGEKLVSREFSKFNVKSAKTGGTTGVPARIFKDSNNRTYTWASYYRWYEWMGINYYDPVTTLWGAKTVLTKSFANSFYGEFKHTIQNKTSFNSFELSVKRMESIYNTLIKNKSVLLKGYLSSMLDFAEYIEFNRLELPKLNAISTTTETLLHHHRSYLQKVFNVPIFDQYGCGEVSAISYECKKHNGLHINQEHVICEILDKENNQIINNSGRVIVTDIDNYVMPFIRYENGDLATVSTNKCSCGVNQPLMLSIEGRSIETLILKNGNSVHGVFITDILYELGIMTDSVRKFQVHQTSPGIIVLLLESKVGIGHEKQKRLLKSLLQFFTEVSIEEVDYIKPSATGKFKYVVSDIVK